MSGEGIATIITSVATLVTALGGVVVSLYNGRKVDENTRITKDIHEAVTNDGKQ